MVMAPLVDRGLKVIEGSSDACCRRLSLRHDLGECGTQQPGIGTGEEQGDSEACRCELIAVAARNAFDNAVKAQSAEIIRHSAGRVGGRVKPEHLRQQCTQFGV